MDNLMLGNSSNVIRHPQCENRTKLGNCDPVGGFCTSVPKEICDTQVHNVLKDTDIVSRQAVIKAIHDEWDEVCNYDGSGHEIANYTEEAIDRVPAANSVKHGKWIKMSDPYGVYWACSECGEELPRISHFSLKFDLSQRLESIDKTKYCPNCGIKMDEELQ